MTDPAARDRVVLARLKLRERFLARMEGTPARADGRPLGSGPKNRHGMPRLPPDQTPTAPGSWPVLDLGGQPDLTPEKWHLRVDGACGNPLVLRYPDLLALEQVDETSDFHCVTGWSKLDVRFRGVRLSTVLALAEPHDAARFVLTHAWDGYATNLPLEEALKDDVLLVTTAEDEPLPREHGGPVRVVTPQLWAWKGAKWVKRLELLDEDVKGFWEEHGYSNTAHPWRNDRYAPSSRAAEG